MSNSLPAKFRDWSDASTYRTVTDSYTKTEVDNSLSLKANSSALSSYILTNDALDALNNKANSADVYTKTAADNLLADKADSANVYSKSEIDTQMSNKASASTVSGLVDYKAAVKVLARALQASLTLQDPDTPNSGFNWSILTA